MYAYFKGTLVSFNPSLAVVEIQGIGYAISIPCNVFVQLPPLGQQIHFYTSYVIREFSQALYGFLSLQDKELFETLMNVSGIGPKTALSIIGHLPTESLCAAITNEDIPTLCRIPGIGKKSAERLIIELRDKIASFGCSKLPEQLAISVHKDPKLQRTQDAVLALINLGYTQQVAQKAVRASLKELKDECDLPSLITSALKNV